MEACEAPRRLLVRQGAGEPDEHVIEAKLSAADDHTILIAEVRGLHLDKLYTYGAWVQINVEDLAAYLAGREHCDADARWDELLPAYADLAGRIT